jgi:hypothetical protein
VAFGHVGAFSQVSVVFEQENPLSFDYMQRAVGSAILRPMPVHVRSQAAWGRSPVAALVVVERAIGLLFRSSLDRVLTPTGTFAHPVLLHRWRGDRRRSVQRAPATRARPAQLSEIPHLAWDGLKMNLGIVILP